MTKIFVDSTSYILKATIDKKKGKNSSKKIELWDPKKLDVGDYFSCISYLKIEKIDCNQITVNNHRGGKWLISKDLLERDMWSADHYEKEIKCTMTDLSTILSECGDTIFTVKFKK